jgi:phosphohistidine phosphatase SixA
VGAALSVAVTPAAELAPGCNLDGLTTLLAAALAAGQPKSLLIVGHEPDLSTLVGELIGRDGPAQVEMKKASCARVDVSLTTGSALALAGRGILVWLLRAKQLALIGG